MCTGVVESEESHHYSSSRYSRRLRSPLTNCSCSSRGCHCELSFPIVIELGDTNSVTATHYGFVDVIQRYQVKTLHTPTFRLSLLQSTNWIWWADNYFGTEYASLQSSLQRCNPMKCIQCQSTAARSSIRDAAWICQTSARCGRQRNIVSSSSPQPTSIRMLCQ